jgi:hypothetical protein
MSLSSLNDKSSFNIAHLPVEIICQIFNHLSFYDKKNASICCKQWRSVFLEIGFLRDVAIKANNNLFTSRPVSSQSNLRNQPPQHRASSSMALSSYSNSSLSRFDFYLYNNAVNLEFDKDSADVAMFMRNLGKLIISSCLLFFNFK